MTKLQSERIRRLQHEVKELRKIEAKYKKLVRSYAELSKKPSK